MHAAHPKRQVLVRLLYPGAILDAGGGHDRPLTRNAQRTSLWETRLLENRSEGQSGGGSVDFPSIDKPSADTRAGGEGTDAELGLGVSRYDR